MLESITLYSVTHIPNVSQRRRSPVDDYKSCAASSQVSDYKPMSSESYASARTALGKNLTFRVRR